MIGFDGCASQFRSKLVIHIVSRMFLEKTFKLVLHHPGKGLIGEIGGTTKNVIFLKVKFGHIKVNTHAEFVDAAKKIVRSISTVYIPASCMMLEPGVIESALSTKRDFANTMVNYTFF